MLLRIFSTSLLMVLATSLFGQIKDETDESEKQSIIEQRIEIIANTLEEGQALDYTTLLEGLTYHFEHPLDLNSASTEDLRDLNLLSDIQIAGLQRHISRYGYLRSIYELQAVRGFDPATINLIRPFVTVGAPGMMKDFTFRQMFKEGTNDFFLRYMRPIQQQAGYKPNPKKNDQPSYTGSPNYFYTRYRFLYRKNISAGFTLEKDQGESIKNGPDFASGFVFIRNKTFLRALALGDYQAQFGQGLTYWNGLGFGKSVYVMNVKKNAMGLKPYTSVNEALFMRGAAATIGMGRFELTGMYSQKKLSANLVALVDSSIAVDDGFTVSSILTGGLHRTESEIAKRRTLGERIYGGNIKYTKGTFSTGFTAAGQEYASPLSRDNDLYQQYRFDGTHNATMGIDYQGVLRNANFFGEFSRSLNGGFAALNGLVASLHPSLVVSVVHRYFQKDYQPIYSNVFAEGNNLAPSNEHGLFLGMQANFPRGWILSAYTDQVTYPWLRYKVQTPGVFSDYLAQMNYKPDKKHEFYFRYRVRHSTQDTGDPTEIIDYPLGRRQQNFRLNAIYMVHPNIQMRTRGEWTVFERERAGREQGFMIYQDVIFNKPDSPISINLRYALFQTQGTNARIYAYESDVLYRFSIPAYSGLGSRFYTVIKYDIIRGVDLWLKVGTWVYNDRKKISSGDGEIEGNTRTDITAQLRWQF